MNTVILNGTGKDSRPDVLNRSGNLFARELEKKGWAVTHIKLSEKTIAPCCGRFKCWIQTPGECVIKDDQLEVIQHIIKSGMIIYLTPVTFGGYSSQLKKTLDRILPVLLPFFIKVSGEIHHPQRYPNKRRIIALGTQREPNDQTERIFHNLVRRNALNMNIQDIMTEVIPDSIDDRELEKKISDMLHPLEVAR